MKTALLRGSVAEALLDYESEVSPDLTVMATHGRTGPTRVILGSVADRVVRDGVVPLLLLPPTGPGGGPMRTALLPLDGSLLAAEALQMLLVLADRPLKRVRLLRVIKSDEERQKAATYLDEVARQLAVLELDVRVDVSTDPAYALEAAAGDVDVVVMSTHGEGGATRLRHGKVAEYAAHHLGTPVLFVRPAELATSQAIAQFLPTVPIFREVDPTLLARLVRFAHHRTYPQGDVIVREGQIGVGFFIIRSGRVEVLKDHNGRSERLATLETGDVFGEIAVIERGLRTATVRALEPTTCIALTGWTLRTLLEESPDAMGKLHSLAMQRLAEKGIVG